MRLIGSSGDFKFTIQHYNIYKTRSDNANIYIILYVLVIIQFQNHQPESYKNKNCTQTVQRKHLWYLVCFIFKKEWQQVH